MIIKRIIIVFIILILSSLVQAQSEDNGLWLNGSAGYKIAKKLDGSTNISIRFNNNFLQYNNTNIGTGIKYKLNKRLKTSLDYRYSTDNYKLENRISLGLKWSDKIIKRTDLSIKTKVQTEVASNTTYWTNTSRTKTVLMHKIKKKKIYPSIFTEIFFGLNPTQYNFQKSRIGCGIDFKQIKKHTFSIGYFKNILFNELSSNSNILTLDYKIKL